MNASKTSRLLRQAGSLVGFFSDEIKTPASAKNEEASKAVPAASEKASAPEKSAAPEESPAPESDAAPEKAIGVEGTPADAVSASAFSEEQKKLFSKG